MKSTLSLVILLSSTLAACGGDDGSGGTAGDGAQSSGGDPRRAGAFAFECGRVTSGNGADDGVEECRNYYFDTSTIQGESDQIALHNTCTHDDGCPTEHALGSCVSVENNHVEEQLEYGDEGDSFSCPDDAFKVEPYTGPLRR